MIMPHVVSPEKIDGEVKTPRLAPLLEDEKGAAESEQEDAFKTGERLTPRTPIEPKIGSSTAKASRRGAETQRF